MKKLFSILALLSLLALSLSACVQQVEPTTEAPAEETEAPPAETEPAGDGELGEVLKIGMLSMQSGVMSLYGIQQHRGFMLGLEYVSGGKTDEEGRYIVAGRPVEVLLRDTEGDPEKGVALARELIESEGVELLQGPVSSAVAAALTTVAEENKIILMVDPAASAFTTGKYFNPYVFRTARTNYDDTLVIAKYLVENVGPTFAHIGVDNAFGQGSGQALAYSVAQHGGEVVADIYAPFETTDFTPYIQQAMDSGADNLFLTWAGTGYVTLFQQLSDLGALEDMTVATGYGDNASFAAVYGAALGQIGLNVYHYTAADNEINDWLSKRHLEEYNEPPDLFTAGGMASAIAFAEALEKTGGDTDADKMIAALEGLKFEGPKGTYYIRPEDHVCEQPMNILKLVNLEPDKDGDGVPEYEFFETVYVSEYDELGVPCTLEGDYADRCGDLPTSTSPGAAQPAGDEEPGEVLKIGMLSMQSGVMSLYGIQQYRGFMLGLEYLSGGETDEEGRYIVAGRPVEVLLRDTEGDPEKGVALARELIESEGVEILQGPVSSAVAAALTTVAEENKIILMVDPAASAFTTGKYFNPYVFRTARTNYDDTLVIAKYLVENVGPTFAHIGVDNAFGQGSGQALAYSVAQHGGEVIADIYAPFDTTDFTPYIQQAMDSGADNLFLTWAGTGYVTLFQQLSDLGALEDMTVATGYGDNASFAAVYGAALGQIGLNVYHYTAADNEINNWLTERHIEEYSEPPDLFTAGGMASAIALAEALEKTGGDTNADKMIAALEGLKFEGPKGTYYIRPEDHVCEQPMNILKLVNLEPDQDGDGVPEYKFFETVYISKYDELGVPCTLEGDYADRCGDLPTP